MSSLRRYTDCSEMLSLVGARLRLQEAEFNLLLGILARPTPEGAYGYVTPDAGIAFYSGKGLILGGYDVALTPDVAAVVAAEPGPPLPFLVGSADLVQAFADAYSPLRQVTEKARMAQRIYRLDNVIAVTGVPGDLAASTQGVMETCCEWISAFADEATHNLMTPAEGQEWVKARHLEGSLHLWKVDGIPVSMTATGRRTDHGITVNAVYTPPEYRRKGYASALVAAVSQRELDSGRQFVTLYTDLSNPTSNRIYQEIGFQPVADSLEIGLG